MTKTELESARSALIKLKEQIDSGDMVVFEPEEAKALKEMATIFNRMKGAVWLAQLLGASLKWIVGVGLAYVAFKAGLLDFLSKGEAS